MRLEAQINGGGQERGIRSGTVPAPLVVGLGAACAIAKQELHSDLRRAPIPAGHAPDGKQVKVTVRPEA